MEPEPAPISVTVVGGYLGAGKTTLLNRILSAAPARTAVLVNDFGAVDIDTALIDSVDEAAGVVSLANGCICCTITDGLVGALDTVRDLDPRPERLVIEASGVGRPAEIANYAALPGFRLDSILVVADAEQVRASARDKYVGDVVLDQLAAADLLVLNKADLVGHDRLAETVDWASGVAPTATIVTAVRGDVPLDLLLGQMPERPAATPGAVHHDHADSEFESWSCTTTELFDGDLLDAALVGLPEHVLRVKGIVRTVQQPDRRTIVHRVGRRVERSDGGTWRDPASRIVVIGRAGALDHDWLDGHFARTRH